MLEIEQLKYNADGLIPTIVIDTDTKQVLMLAYMNAESLRVSMEEGRTCFWSRSRQELWIEGPVTRQLPQLAAEVQ